MDAPVSPPENQRPSGAGPRWIALVVVLLAVAAVVGLRLSRRGASEAASSAIATNMKDRYRGISKVSADPVLGHELIPNAGRGMKVVNDLGYIGKKYPKERSPNTYRVLGLGGSNTMFYGAEGQNYLALLEKELAANHPGKTVEALDFGIEGETLKSAVRRFEVSGAAYKPDLLIVGVTVDQIVDLKATLEEMAKKPVADPSSAEGLAAMPVVYKFLGTSREAKQAFYDRLFASQRWRDAVIALNDLERLSQANGTQVVLTTMPLLLTFEPYQFQPIHDALRVQAERHKFGFVDLTPRFSALHDLAEYRESDDVIDYSPKGHALVAEAIRSSLSDGVAQSKP